MNSPKHYFRTLTIAGSDSGGGAGIQADIKTFSALGCYGMSVVTALTAQDTVRVHSVFEVSPQFVEEQLSAILDDIGVDSVKIGMLNRTEIIYTVAQSLKVFKVKNIVLDPVMVSKNGDPLLKKEAVEAMKEELFPVTLILTPNLPEASTLLNQTIETRDDMEFAARELVAQGPRYVVVKGGHMNGTMSSDFVYSGESDYGTWLERKRIETNNTHGTGCTLSSAIAAHLAKGHEAIDAVRRSKEYLGTAIEAGANYNIGHGHGPVHHFFNHWPLS